MECLFIDNHDSFSYNVIQLLQKQNYEVSIIQNTDELPKNLDFKKIIISPGPGSPENEKDLGNIFKLIDMNRNSKFLGICFGHQALGRYLGCQIITLKRPYHGEVDTIAHFGSPIYRDIPNTFRAIRYHSLAILENSNIIVDARSESDNSVMGFHSKNGNFYGVQFHPESFYSEYGENIIINFMEM
ncbi:aminodeoxychorismate/anthranilate synthase component II [Caldiplasma sukawensis]